MPEAQYEVIVAVICADISGSTALYDKVGNTEAHAQITKTLGILRDVIEEDGGEFVHSRGDDVICTFESAENAFETVKHMLERTKGGDLSVHIGLEFGQAIRQRDDIFGDCVNGAARLASLANSDEALCSAGIRSRLKLVQQAELHFFDTRKLRGRADTENVYRYADVPLDAGTQISFGNMAETTDLSTLYATLTFEDQTVKCTPSHPITIGRADTCDLVIPRRWVSRQHAIVEMGKGHAYLKDISSNGTFVCIADQPPLLMRRESMALPTQCTLMPTNPADAEEAVSIGFELVNNSDPNT